MKEIGENIKKIRETKKLTLRHLASKINTSASFLSQVETGKATPSLSTLKRLADSLGTTIGVLVDGEDFSNRQNPILHKEDRIQLDGIGHQIDITIISPKNITNQLQSYYVYFYPNGDTGEFNKHAGQEWGLVISGEIEMFYKDEVYTIKKDDTFYYNAMEPHFFRNNSKESTLILFVSTPPLF